MLLAEKPPPAPPPASEPLTTASGGLKLPPFPPRKLSEMHTNETPVSYMTKEQANEMKEFIFAQLNEFEL
jgi:serine/threonine-protein phosphatase 4 regulatory subunit 2